MAETQKCPFSSCVCWFGALRPPVLRAPAHFIFPKCVDSHVSLEPAQDARLCGSQGAEVLAEQSGGSASRWMVMEFALSLATEAKRGRLWEHGKVLEGVLSSQGGQDGVVLRIWAAAGPQGMEASPMCAIQLFLRVSLCLSFRVPTVHAWTLDGSLRLGPPHRAERQGSASLQAPG